MKPFTLLLTSSNQVTGIMNNVWGPIQPTEIHQKHECFNLNAVKNSPYIHWLVRPPSLSLWNSQISNTSKYATFNHSQFRAPIVAYKIHLLHSIG